MGELEVVGGVLRACRAALPARLALVVVCVWLAACSIPERTYDPTLAQPAGSGGAAGAPDPVDASGSTDATPEPIVPPAPSLCDQYCDQVFAPGRCSGSVQVYESPEQCRAVCARLPEGSPGDTSGNSVHCRLGKLNAASFEANDCDNVGPLTRPAAPDGPETCGDPCEVFCELERSVCADRGEEAYCQTICPKLRQAATFRASDFADADTLQCRFGHLARALEAEDPRAECTRAQIMLTQDAPCRDSLEAVSEQDDAQLYCRLIQASCEGENAAYESEEQCRSVASVFARGAPNDFETNSLRCRLYHSYLSLGPEKAMHCRHAGPSGDGKCAPPAESSQGNCRSYCDILREACSDELGGFDDGDCMTTCLALGDSGAGQFAAEPAYSVNTQLESGSLKCRMLHAVRARGGNLDSCAEAVSPDATCPAPPLQ